MYCQKCTDKHKNHNIVFFKDNFVYPNYDNVRQVQQPSYNNFKPANLPGMVTDTDSQQMSIYQNMKYELYKANDKMNREAVFIKCIKDFKSRPQNFKNNILERLQQELKYSDHQNIINYKHWVIANNNLYIIQEQGDFTYRQKCDYIKAISRKNDFVPIIIAIDYLSALYYLWSENVVDFSYGPDCFDNFIFKDGFFKLNDIFLNRHNLGRNKDATPLSKLEIGKLMAKSLSSMMTFIESIVIDLPNTTTTNDANSPKKNRQEQTPKMKVVAKYQMLQKLYKILSNEDLIDRQTMTPNINQYLTYLKSLLDANQNKYQEAIILMKGYNFIDKTVAGGPIHYEVVIYKQNRQTNEFEYSDSIDTFGQNVTHMTQNKETLLIVTSSNEFQLYYKSKGSYRLQQSFNYHSIGPCSSLIELKQYRQDQKITQSPNPHQSFLFQKNYYLSAHLLGSFNLVEVHTINQKRSLMNVITCGAPSDAKVFSLCEMRNGDILAGCSKGMIRFIDRRLLFSQQQLQLQMQQPTLDLIDPKKKQTEIQIPEMEPIISLHEASLNSDSNLIVFATLNSVLYILNYKTRELIQRIGDQNQMSPTICHFMVPYFDFDSENNPVIIVCQGTELKFMDLKKMKQVVIADVCSHAYNWSNELDCLSCKKKSSVFNSVQLVQDRREIILAIDSEVQVIKYE